MNLEKHSKHTIDQISISDEEKNRLAQARSKALNEPQGISFNRLFSAPVLAYASILVIIGLVSFSSFTPNVNETPSFDDEFAYLNSLESVEMVEQLDFYIWIESQHINTNTGA